MYLIHERRKFHHIVSCHLIQMNDTTETRMSFDEWSNRHRETERSLVDIVRADDLSKVID